jgi:hypothetical protein
VSSPANDIEELSKIFQKYYAGKIRVCVRARTCVCLCSPAKHLSQKYSAGKIRVCVCVYTCVCLCSPAKYLSQKYSAGKIRVYIGVCAYA